MKASELIKALETAIQEHGDLPAVIQDYEYGDHNHVEGVKPEGFLVASYSKDRTGENEPVLEISIG